jgi:hypothetical protein
MMEAGQDLAPVLDRFAADGVDLSQVLFPDHMPDRLA